MNKSINLNLIAPEDIGDGSYQILDNSTVDSKLSVYFRDLEAKVIENILVADALFGCVAWLTNANILDALSKVKNVSILVQKEDFLRPDINVSLLDKWKVSLQTKYNSLTFSYERHNFTNLGSLNMCGDTTMDAIRCVGNSNSDKLPAVPRMHNKFLVFCRTEKVYSSDNDSVIDKTTESLKPYAVWTGSFNFTDNGGYSLENAVIIHSPKIALAYMKEWEQIYSISESLDWENDWCSPEYRVGT